MGGDGLSPVEGAGTRHDGHGEVLSVQVHHVVEVSVDDEGDGFMRDLLLGWVFVVFCYGEVHNMPLEEVRGRYAKDAG